VPLPTPAPGEQFQDKTLPVELAAMLFGSFRMPVRAAVRLLIRIVRKWGCRSVRVVVHAAKTSRTRVWYGVSHARACRAATGRAATAECDLKIALQTLPTIRDLFMQVADAAMKLAVHVIQLLVQLPHGFRSRVSTQMFVRVA
jgi:hypothetical protein